MLADRREARLKHALGGRFATGFNEKAKVTYIAVYRLEEV
jgi:hypothetical protein